MSLLSKLSEFIGANKTVIAVLLILVGVIGTQAGMLYLGDRRLQAIQESFGSLQQTVTDQKAVIDTLQARFADANRAAEAMTQRTQAIQEDTARMAKALAKAKLAETANKQPAQVQSTVNKTTLDVLRDLEAITDPNRVLGGSLLPPAKKE